MRSLLILCQLSVLFLACIGQSEKQPKGGGSVGGKCEGCEALFEYGDRQLISVDTLPSFKFGEPKLKITGTVYDRSGNRPVPGVIIYIYHTDHEGLYTSSPDAEGWGRRHGKLRGWAMTDKIGQYTFYTIRPSAYPSGSEPEHIHFTVKEENIFPYYISDIVFTDDALMTSEKQKYLSERGGSGLITIDQNEKWGLITRDIFLGRDIPNYPD